MTSALDIIIPWQDGIFERRKRKRNKVVPATSLLKPKDSKIN
jgi:hypothetical protein